MVCVVGFLFQVLLSNTMHEYKPAKMKSSEHFRAKRASYLGTFVYQIQYIKGKICGTSPCAASRTKVRIDNKLQLTQGASKKGKII
jgi:hypothetical protein